MSPTTVIFAAKPLPKDIYLFPLPSFPTHQFQGQTVSEDWQIDFTHMHKYKTLKHLFVLICTFSGWIETFPTTLETADVVSNIPIQKMIPQFGLPQTIQSDNGPAFISQVTWV